MQFHSYPEKSREGIFGKMEGCLRTSCLFSLFFHSRKDWEAVRKREIDFLSRFSTEADVLLHARVPQSGPPSIFDVGIILPQEERLAMRIKCPLFFLPAIREKPIFLAI